MFKSLGQIHCRWRQRQPRDRAGVVPMQGSLRAVLLHPQQSLWSSFPAPRPGRACWLCPSSCQPQELLHGVPSPFIPPTPHCLRLPHRTVTPPYRAQVVLLSPPSPFPSLQFQGNLDVTQIRGQTSAQGWERLSVTLSASSGCIPDAPRAWGHPATPTPCVGLEELRAILPSLNPHTSSSASVLHHHRAF